MRRLSFLILVCIFSGLLHAQEFLPEYARGTAMDEYLPSPPLQVIGDPPSDDDVAALESLFETYHEAWWAEDHESLIATYWPDAHWTNAFGLVLRGHEEMRAFFPVMFRQFDASETAKSKTIHIRFIGDDVAIVQRFTQSGGGIANRDGEGQRQIQITNVLQKRNGQWKTLHQMIMDVRL